MWPEWWKEIQIFLIIYASLSTTEDVDLAVNSNSDSFRSEK